jgi:predicted DNA-binding transcriptional regulator AlpA
MAADACKVAGMGREVDVDDLIDTQDVARLLGLAHRNTVSEYQMKYADMPRPVIDLGRGRSKLWLRPEVEHWRAQRVAAGRTRAKRRAAR